MAEVLIVPSGIETADKESAGTYRGVLIVPSGIETCAAETRPLRHFVLIVPSGIETGFCGLNKIGTQSINCT